MNFKYLIAGLGLGVLAANVQADYIADVQLSLGAGYGEYDVEMSDDIEVDTSYDELAATIYLGRVSTDAVPIREAAFLSHRSSIGVYRQSAEVEYDFGYGYPELTVKSSDKGIVGRFVIAGPDLILMAGLTRGDYDSEVDLDGRLLGLGIYLDQRTALTLQYTVVEAELKRNPSVDLDDEKTIELAFKRTQPTGSKGYLAYRVEFSTYDDGDDYDSTTFGGGVTWYPMPKFGFGVNLSLSSGSGDGYDDSEATVSPHISFDFNENVGFFAELDSTAGEYDGGSDEEFSFVGLTTGLNVRF